jgi:hypothetical protein
MSQWVTGMGKPYGLVGNGNFLYATNIIDIPGVGEGTNIRTINKTDGTYTDLEILGGNPTGNGALATDGTYLYNAYFDNNQPYCGKRLLSDLSSVGSFGYNQFSIPDGFGGETYVYPTRPNGLVIVGDYIYSSHSSDGGLQTSGVLSKISKIDGTFDYSFGGSEWGYYNPGSLLNLPIGLVSDGTYIYIANNNDGKILKFNPSTLSIEVFKDQLSGVFGLTISNGYIYASLFSSNIVRKILLSDSNVITTEMSTGLASPLELSVSNNVIYVANLANNNLISGYIARSAQNGVACFKENTKILTDKGYIPIQNLRQGAMVKTVRNGFKPISLIGKSNIYHSFNSDKQNQLYKCSTDQYPELFEDLIMTGSHAILVGSFKNDERERTQEFYKKIFVTDNNYRFPVCLDNRSSVYEKEGKYTIYHIALENDNNYMNYGIYANGLLVESTSKNFMKNKSNMTLL